jgi:hypothetical protein
LLSTEGTTNGWKHVNFLSTLSDYVKALMEKFQGITRCDRQSSSWCADRLRYSYTVLHC